MFPSPFMPDSFSQTDMTNALLETTPGASSHAASMSDVGTIRSLAAAGRGADDGAVEGAVLHALMRAAPFQPATNLWRAVEVPVLARSLPQTGNGLDLGCGDGALTMILRDLVGASWRLTGIDPDASEAAAASATGVYEAVYPVAAAALPTPPNSFDFAFSNSVLEHIPNLRECLHETARVLKPGGLFAATVPSPAFHRLLRGPGRFRRQSLTEYWAEIDRRLAHVNYWSATQWRDELAAAGFGPVVFQGYLTRRQLQRWEAWSNWTGGLLYRLRNGREPPIAIQRSLGLRRRLPSALGFAAPLAARATSWGVLAEEIRPETECACWLIVSRKNYSSPTFDMPRS